MPQYHFDLFADYFQFYLQDEQAQPSTDENIWAGHAVDDKLAAEPGIVNIGTVRNMDVPVTVEITDSPPSDDFDAWDHVTEATLDVPSGCIVIAGCTDYFPDAARISVPAGRYRLRAYYGALDSVDEETGLDGDDHYRVVLWTDIEEITPRVLKRWVDRRPYNPVTQNPLIGTWRFVTFAVKDADNETLSPFGEDATGYLIYGNQGYVSLVVTLSGGALDISPFAGREPLIEQVALSMRHLTYAGAYDFQGPDVVHRIDVTPFPEWRGATVSYGVSFTSVEDTRRIYLHCGPSIHPMAWWVWEYVNPGERPQSGGT